MNEVIFIKRRFRSSSLRFRTHIHVCESFRIIFVVLLRNAVTQLQTKQILCVIIF